MLSVGAIHAALAGNAPFDFRAAVDDPRIMILFRELVLRGSSMGNDAEVAAFLVRNDDGTFRAERWPHRKSSNSQTFRGTIPPGTVAIIHTHPLYETGLSAKDCAEAQRVHLPIYVLTRWRISVADPRTGAAIGLTDSGKWIAEAQKRFKETRVASESTTPRPGRSAAPRSARAISP